VHLAIRNNTAEPGVQPLLDGLRTALEKPRWTTTALINSNTRKAVVRIAGSDNVTSGAIRIDGDIHPSIRVGGQVCPYLPQLCVSCIGCCAGQCVVVPLKTTGKIDRRIQRGGRHACGCRSWNLQDGSVRRYVTTYRIVSGTRVSSWCWTLGKGRNFAPHEFIARQFGSFLVPFTGEAISAFISLIILTVDVLLPVGVFVASCAEAPCRVLGSLRFKLVRCDLGFQTFELHHVYYTI